jgi:hypothetical protein
LPFVHFVSHFDFVFGLLVASFLVVSDFQRDYFAMNQPGELGVGIDDLGRSPHHHLSCPLELTERRAKSEIVPGQHSPFPGTMSRFRGRGVAAVRG